MLVYDDAKRLATYTATGTTPASMMSPQGDMSGDRIDLYLEGERRASSIAPRSTAT